ncbi:MAG: hypothetical protein H0U74_22940 [Bradymonadaceae bacterium]|nr:hypothetical protein [Lujinxingiaceae bacterium]
MKKRRQDLAGYEADGKRWKPTCLRCLEFDHLVFLPAGDSRVTRLASRNSSVRVVVMGTERRYLRREGILVEAAALEQACAEYGVGEAESAKIPAPSKVSEEPAGIVLAGQRAMRREVSRNYRFFEGAQDEVAKPASVAKAGDAASAELVRERLVQALVERIGARYPQSPTAMVEAMARFGVQELIVSGGLEEGIGAEEFELGELVSRYLRR